MFLALGWVLLAGLPSPTTIPRATAILRSRPVEGLVTLWTDREEPYPRGSAARVYMSVDKPAYVAVLRVDTDGRIRVLFPREPWGDNHVGTRQAFEVTAVLGSQSFIVDDYPGIGYVFAVASPEPLHLSDITVGDHWDYGLIDGGRIRGDPYVRLTDLAARMAQTGNYDYDIVPYYVGRRYDYPRFVCYDCHAYASYSEWDPYGTSCSRFRVVIRDDPRYYPYRYGGGRNIVPGRSLHPGPRYLFEDAKPGNDYVTRVPAPKDGRRRILGDNDARTEAAPERSPMRPRIQERRPVEGEGIKPTPAPRSTGEPELRRRRP
jgi:Domain of unknown function (DUF4384)